MVTIITNMKCERCRINMLVNKKLLNDPDARYCHKCYKLRKDELDFIDRTEFILCNPELSFDDLEDDNWIRYFCISGKKS